MSSAWLKAYPPDWPNISNQIRERDGWKCSVCGVKHFSVIRRKRFEEYVLWSENATYNEAVASQKEAQRKTRQKHIIVIIHACHMENPSPFDTRPEQLKSLCQMHHHWVDNELRAKTRRETWARKRAKKQAETTPVEPAVVKEERPVIRLHGRNWGQVSERRGGTGATGG